MQKRISNAKDWLYDESGNSDEIASSSKSFQSVEFFCRPRLKVSFHFMQTRRNSDRSSPENIGSPDALDCENELTDETGPFPLPGANRRMCNPYQEICPTCRPSTLRLRLRRAARGNSQVKQGKCSMPVSDRIDQFRSACTLVSLHVGKPARSAKDSPASASGCVCMSCRLPPFEINKWTIRHYRLDKVDGPQSIHERPDSDWPWDRLSWISDKADRSQEYASLQRTALVVT
jgi:hypothetical protein